jgi:hypothetical protein
MASQVTKPIGYWLSGIGLSFQALLAVLLLPPLSASADISEPSTVFYGKIINRTSGEEYLLSQGTLTWVVTKPDGSHLTLTAALQSLNNGQFSYRLDVPQEALSYGLTVSSAAVPLALNPAACSHAAISVNGYPASILAPGTKSFSVSQSVRASTYRLDLEVFNPLSDTAGDGIPDWWKAMFNIVDPNADPMNDGWSNLMKFLLGANPTQDDRKPTLPPTELFVYADGRTGIHLNALDSDSAATNIFYTITSLPQSGALYLRNSNPNPSDPDARLALGSGFTQDDINHGRLIFAQEGTNVPAAEDSFQVSLHDENPAHPATNTTVSLNVYRPGYDDATLQLARTLAATPATVTNLPGFSFYEQQMLLNYYLSRDQGFVVWDVSRATAPQTVKVPSSGLTATQYSQYVTTYGHDRRYALMGGAGNDYLVGGMESDVIIGGRGVDTMRGNGGSDLFVIAGPGSSALTIEDFNTADKDMLDISRVLTGLSPYLTNYVQVTSSGGNAYLNINFNGSGANYTNLVVTLLGSSLTQSDLRSLVDNGYLLTGGKNLAPQVTILATTPASENGPVAGVFTLNRTGATDSALTVNLQISGSAVNGSDYQYIQPQATFPAGQRTATLTVNPYQTTSVLTQIVQVALSPGAGYEFGSNTLAQVTIAPLSPQITIQALEPIASRLDQSSGVFLVSRGGVVANSLLVRLTIGGTAPASHYNSLSSFINFAPQQTTALISVTPRSTALITNTESVQITIKPDPSYVVMNPSTDRVLLVDQILSMSVWQQKYFPTNSDDPLTFSVEDPGHTGIANLYRYAFGLNPLNPRFPSKGMPVYSVLNDRLSVSFKEPAAISDLNYFVEVSADLRNWSSNGIEQFFPPVATNDFETVSFRSTSSVSGTPRQFMRVRVQFQ